MKFAWQLWEFTLLFYVQFLFFCGRYHMVAAFTTTYAMSITTNIVSSNPAQLSCKFHFPKPQCKLNWSPSLATTGHAPLPNNLFIFKFYHFNHIYINKQQIYILNCFPDQKEYVSFLDDKTSKIYYAPWSFLFSKMKKVNHLTMRFIHCSLVN
jgi:hypothetical protein